MIDESAMLNSDLLKLANKSKHLFICISRAAPFRMDYPLFGMYKLLRTETDDTVSFDLINMPTLPIAKDFEKHYDNIVVEASKGRSEHQLLSTFIEGVKPSNGRDRIEKTLRTCKGSVLVLADLGNIGKAYDLLLKRCEQNPCVVFYKYICFEQLLYYSNMVRNIKSGGKNINPFDTFSLEHYYEIILEYVTKGLKQQN